LPSAAQVPRYPVGLALVPVIAQGVLRLGQQIVGGVGRVDGRPAWVAQR
jgi:hypothetical protein